MDYEQKLTGKVIKIDSDEVIIEFTEDHVEDILRGYNIRDTTVVFNKPVDIEKCMDLNVIKNSRVRVGLLVSESGEVTLDICEKLYNYSKDELENALNILLTHNKVFDMVPQIMAEHPQVPIDFHGQEQISSDDIKNFVNDDELFIDNPNYIKDNNFNVYDYNGNIIFTIEHSELSGYGHSTSKNDELVRFVFPFKKLEHREAFIDFCDTIQRKKAVKYPKE